MEILERMIDERRDLTTVIDDLKASLPALSFKAETNATAKKKLAKVRREIAAHTDRVAVLNPAIEGAEDPRLKAQAEDALRQLNEHRDKARAIHRDRIKAAEAVDKALIDLEEAVGFYRALLGPLNYELNQAGMSDPTIGRRAGRDLLASLWKSAPVLCREIDLEVRGRHHAILLADCERKRGIQNDG